MLAWNSWREYASDVSRPDAPRHRIDTLMCYGEVDCFGNRNTSIVRHWSTDRSNDRAYLLTARWLCAGRRRWCASGARHWRDWWHHGRCAWRHAAARARVTVPGISHRCMVAARSYSPCPCPCRTPHQYDLRFTPSLAQLTKCILRRSSKSADSRSCALYAAGNSQYSVEYSTFSGVTRGGGRTAPGDTLQGGDTRRQKLWANLQRIVEKRGRTGKKCVGWHPRGGWHPSESNKKR